MSEMKKRGRPKVYLTEEARQAAIASSRHASKAKTKNVTVDADLVDQLGAVADRLETMFGFRPTISQALRYLIKHSMDREQS